MKRLFLILAIIAGLAILKAIINTTTAFAAGKTTTEQVIQSTQHDTPEKFGVFQGLQVLQDSPTLLPGMAS
jgi:hypothetical protein